MFLFYIAPLVIGQISLGPFVLLLFFIASQYNLGDGVFGAIVLLMTIVVFIALWKWSRSKLWSKKRHLTLIIVWLSWGAFIALLGISLAV